MDLSTFIANVTLISATQVINFTIAVLALLLGAVVLFSERKQRNAVTLTFFLVAINAAFWTFSSTMADVSREYYSALMWTRMAIVGPFIFTAAFLVLAMCFPDGKKLPRGWKMLLIFLPSIFAVLTVATPLNVVSITLRDWGTDFEPGPLYSILFLNMIVYFILAARSLFRVSRNSNDPVTKKQVLYLYVGMTLFVASGVFTNLILPLVFNYTRASVIGPAATLFFIVLTMYAIVKHGLLNIKIIATELFSGALMFISFIQIFRSASVFDLMVNSGVFLATGVAAVLLVRSVFDEISRREQIQTLAAQLESANSHLKEMDNLKNEFISIASHQLRTPITVIKGYLALMLEGAYGPLSEALTQKVTSMNMMNERLVQMINNMLNVSRIERNRIEFTCAVIDLYPVIGQAVEEMTTKAAAKGISLRVEGATAGPVEAYVDMEKTIEVLTNLIDNAIKYSTKGSITVSAVLFPKKKTVVVTVTDEGYGMNKEDVQKMFTKFYRSSDPAIVSQTGTGLGLYVCAMFVRGMGGDIWVEKSAPGKGTAISFALPTEPGGECAAPTRKKSRSQ